ncbi:hypothetical protein VNO77_26939 [Canavalia gladiata]|uniref:Uncharacterized protein n=1 Tax=Canavalia gladiata TaxID=3824 RepID=A0AAN9Q3S4_CANGL
MQVRVPNLMQNKGGDSIEGREIDLVEWIVVTDASKLASCSDIFRSGKKKIPGLPALLVETCDGRLHKDCKLTISLEAEDFSRRYRHMTVGISVAGQQTDFLSMLETNLDGPVKIAEV